MQYSTAIRTLTEETLIGASGVPRTGGGRGMPSRIELAELCRKNQGHLYKVIRRTHTSPFLPHPIITPDCDEPAASWRATVTEQEQALDLRAHGQKMPLPKARPPLPTQGHSVSTQEAMQLP